MVYPTPPGTTNIHVYVEETELGWSDCPYDTRHTAIGDWNIIYCAIEPVFEQLGAHIHNIYRNNNKIDVKLTYNDITETIEILSFPLLMEEMVELFKKHNYLRKDFQDPRLRGLQYLVNQIRKGKV